MFSTRSRTPTRTKMFIFQLSTFRWDTADTVRRRQECKARCNNDVLRRSLSRPWRAYRLVTKSYVYRQRRARGCCCKGKPRRRCASLVRAVRRLACQRRPSSVHGARDICRNPDLHQDPSTAMSSSWRQGSAMRTRKCCTSTRCKCAPLVAVACKPVIRLERCHRKLCVMVTARVPMLGARRWMHRSICGGRCACPLAILNSRTSKTAVTMLNLRRPCTRPWYGQWSIC
jgi:hypothetical protein